jgi:hypothetical protein
MHLHTVLWIVQIILGIKLLNVAYTHGLRQSQPTMQAAIQTFGISARPLLYAVAIFALAGASGLILPGILGSPAGITCATATVMSFLLLLSIFFHIRRREKPRVFVSVVLFAFALFIAYGRGMLDP